MSAARTIISGTLHKRPVEKTSKAGKPYVTASLREVAGDKSRWWTVLIFRESARATLLAMNENDAVAVAGEFDTELYTSEAGETWLSWKLIGDGVLSIKRPPREPEGGK
jgi:hypothetical protein